MSDNIVNWGLVESGWSAITVDANGNDTYGAVQKFKGLRSVSFTANGDTPKVYADGTIIYVGKNNNGYTGTMEFTNPDEAFLRYVLGETLESGLQYEELEPVVNRVALLWEWEGDQRKTRHCMYNCTISRPDLSSITKGDGGTKTAQYMTLNIEAIPRPNDDRIKVRSTETTTSTVYDNWFTAVPGDSSALRKVTITVKDGTTPIENATVVCSDGTIGFTNSAGQVIFMKVGGSTAVKYSFNAGANGKYGSVVVSVGTSAVTGNISLAAPA